MNLELIQYDILILGGGPAGLSAAIYAGRSKYKTAIVSTFIGGQLNMTKDISNYPGFNAKNASELIKILKTQVSDLDVPIINSNIISIEKEKDGFIVITKSQKIIAKCIIYSLGSNPKMLENSKIKSYISKGVYTCALCDGFGFIDKQVVVVGGGNKALEESLDLAQLSSKVYLVHRSKEYRAEDKLQQKVTQEAKIVRIYDSVIEDILPNEETEVLNKVIIKNLINDEISEIDAEGLFVAIGVLPNTQLVKDIVKLEPSNHISVTSYTLTSCPGFFSCGEASDNHYRQAIVSAAQGSMCAIDAARYLNMK